MKLLNCLFCLLPLPFAACSTPISNNTIAPPQSGTANQAIHSALANSTTGTVYLEAGEYLVDAPIVMPAGTALIGVGRNHVSGTHVVAAAGYMGRVFDLSGVRDGITIQDLRIQGNYPTRESATGYSPATENHYGIYGTCGGDDRITNVIIDNVDIRHFAMGIHIKGAEWITVKNSTVAENGFDGSLFTHNIYFLRTKNVTIENCMLNDARGGNGLNIRKSSWVMVKETGANRNDFRGIRFGEADSTESDWNGTYFKMELCVTDDNGTNDASLGQEYGVYIFSASNIELINCVASGNSDGDIVMRQQSVNNISAVDTLWNFE